MADDVSLDYPPWQYIYRKTENPFQAGLCDAIVRNWPELAAIRNTPFRKSIEAERVLASDLAAIGFWHSVTNRKYQPLFKQGLNFEVDFYHRDLQVAVEIEKGEIANIWKNICKFAESPVIRHGVLMVPVVRRGRQNSSEFYQNTLKRLGCIERILSLVDSLLVIGY